MTFVNMGNPEAVQMAQSEDGGLWVPQQLVDGINIIADTHLTFSLEVEVGVDEFWPLCIGHCRVAKLLHFSACHG